MFWTCVITLWASVAFAEDTSVRTERLFAQFLSPCCWSESLAVHRSPEAREIRADIERRIAFGESDQQIKQALINAYGRRILVVPDGTQGLWLFVMPVAILLAGTAGVIRIIQRWAPVGGQV